MLWGELSSYFQKKQDHKFEIKRIRLQGDLDAVPRRAAQVDDPRGQGSAWTGVATRSRS